MKKRILSIMLLCYMVLGLLPTTVFANNDGTKAIQLGTSGISGYDSTNNSYDYIHFGTWDNSTVKWRVLDTKTNMPNAQEGDGFFLLSDALLGTGEFGGVEFDYTTPYTNDWRGSRAQDWCNGFYNRNLSTTEQKAVFATSKSDDPYIDGYFMGSENILNGDKVFFLSAEEVRKVAYGFIDDNARIANYGDSAGGWWLRSPHRDYNAAGVVSASGGVSAEWVNDTNAARPAFNLKPDSVLLVSAAVGGKGAADGIFKIPEYSGDEWKLTLLDDTRTFRVTETAAVGKPGGSVTLNFSGARTGQNEYISAIIEGESGATHYGRIMKPTAADTQLSFTLPYDLDSGNYKLYVFSEQCNGDYKTDYASRFQAVALTVEEAANEQFDLVPGGRYYFDLSAMGIPGTANGSLPDASLHYVPFTYAGTVDAYKLTSEMVTTEEYAEQNQYPHSLFVADFAVTHTVNWNALNDASLIFGKNYAAGGVDYMLRAPSAGSDSTGSGDSEHGTPQSNEWDRILDKNGGYIKNWVEMFSWGQDSEDASFRAVRGYFSARYWISYATTDSAPNLGFSPVLEVLNPGTLGSDGLKVVTLDLGGGKLGSNSDHIQIIVKKGESFTAPASNGLTRPDGNTGSYFMWLGSDGELYDPGDSVPAVVNKLTARFAPIEQFSLVPGGTYYFDLSGTGIRGTAHSRLPDKTLHYVPFTYAGTVDAYKLTSTMATTAAYAQQNKYAHSLFVADYAITHTVSWENLNSAGLIFGKGYTSGGVEYTLRAPSVGSSGVGSNYSQHGIPQSNEWDKMLDKDNGYIKNFRQIYSFGQDTTSSSESDRASRGYNAPRIWHRTVATRSNEALGFRPVLEVLNPDTLGSDGLKVVVLDLGGGTLGSGRLSIGSDIQIIVKNGESFTAPASNGLTRPDGNTGSYFMWRGSDGALYAPGDSVPANVNKLTAQFDSIEQFTLVPGVTYYFDLSDAGIPGTANGSLPDASLHYVPFTYAGTVDAYALTSEMATTDEYAEKHKYPHSLFVADFAVTHTISWENLNAAGLIFGKNYTADSVEYTMRVPSAGRSYRGSGDSVRGNPQSNEWDKILDKYDGYIRNCNATNSWGQDVAHNWAQGRAMRGYSSVRNWNFTNASDSGSHLGFRPILEVLNPDTLKPNGLKAVTLDLGGGKLGNSSEDIQIIVKSGESFAAPASDGLTRPDGNTDNYFKWLGSDGELYEPGDNVSADVTKLTAQFAPSSHSVTITTDTLPDGKVGEAYSQILTATGTTPITWSIDDSNLPADLSLNKDTGEISGTPTADGTAKFTVKAENSVGSDTKELSITITKDAPAEFTITVKTDGNGTASASHAKAVVGTEITLTAKPNKGYHFKEWEVISGGVTIKNNKFTMPGNNVEVKAIFEEDTPPAPTEHTVTVTSGGNGTASASPAKTVAGAEITLSATPDKGYHLKEWQVESPAGLVITNNKFTMPDTNVAIKAIFEEDAPPAPTEFTITVKTDGNGTASASHAKAVVGTEITLTAKPNKGYHFKEWEVISGGVTIKNNKFTMPGNNVEVKAIFEEDTPPAPTEHTVTVTSGGNGTASASPAKTVAGAEITLSATPDKGYHLKEWQVESPAGLVITNNKFTMPDTNVAIKAIFEEDAPPAPTEFTITVKTDGNGTASASHAKAVVGTEITLTAKPNKGYHFKEWEVISGGVTIKNNKFTMPGNNVEVKAIFEEDTPPAPTEHTVTVTSGGNGTASASPAKTVAGAEITLSATPDKGYHLKEWQVESPAGLVITNNKFTMPDTNVAIKAIFEEDAPPAPTEFTITVKTDGNGTASASHAKAVVGTEITLTAKPNKGYHFKEWEVISGGVTIKNNKFIMPSANVEVKAIFEEDAPPVPTDPAKPNISVTGTYTYNGSVHTATVNGYDLATMDISGNTATDAGDYTVRVTSKTGKWADGSTDAVTAAWSIGKATQEAPIGLNGVAPTTEGGSDGKITGVDATMEYRAESEITYTACTGIEIENLSAGNYFVRYAEDHNHFASPDAEVTVAKGAPLADCTITFDGNGGSGSMGPVTVKAGANYILPDCGFTAPADQEFKAWEISGTEYKVGDSYTVNGDIEIKALWKNSVITPSTYTVTVSNDGNGTGAATPSTAAAGTNISLSATPNTGYHFKEWQVVSGGVTIENDKFTMPDGNVEIKAIFEKDAAPATPAPTATPKPESSPTPAPAATAKPNGSPTPAPAATAKPNSSTPPAPAAAAKPDSSTPPAPAAAAKPNSSPTPAPAATAKPESSPALAPTATAKPDSSPTPALTAPATKLPVWWVALPIVGGVALAGVFVMRKKKRRR
ncbi:InlB B-repeat-containing protein [Gemmiger formicilis]|uniref:InlB B-repeat-containing protein n=1 Tax=Gemmiger formicilis TaxID=745368 RepID=UPI002431923D|nr:DUF6273 domain-containing protein [Gemmiger formicilis]